MIGQAPITGSIDNHYTDVANFLWANKSDVPAEYSSSYWFNYKGTSGLKLTPLGTRGLGESGSSYYYKLVSAIWLGDKDQSRLMFADGIEISPTPVYQACQARYSRQLTDEELGYKLYIDNCNDQILMLPNTTQSSLVELPRGLERGIALRYANRSKMLITEKWSKICKEADDIRNYYNHSRFQIPPRQNFEYPPCDNKPEISPDPYEKGKEGKTTMWLSAAPPNYGIYAYDYDNKVGMGEYDGSWKTYPTIEIGEYEVTSKNLMIHYRDKWSLKMNWLNFT